MNCTGYTVDSAVLLCVASAFSCSQRIIKPLTLLTWAVSVGDRYEPSAPWKVRPATGDEPITDEAWLWSVDRRCLMLLATDGVGERECVSAFTFSTRLSSSAASVKARWLDVERDRLGEDAADELFADGEFDAERDSRWLIEAREGRVTKRRTGNERS